MTMPVYEVTDLRTDKTQPSINRPLTHIGRLNTDGPPGHYILGTLGGANMLVDADMANMDGDGGWTIFVGDGKILLTPIHEDSEILDVIDMTLENVQSLFAWYR